MENFMTIDEAVNLYGESVFGENDDISETIESFPVKDRTSKSSRRKKTYFKGKKRYKRICDIRGYELEGDNVPIIKGMLKKTNIITPHYEHDPFLSLKLKLKDICNVMDKKEMIADYCEEAV